MPFGERFITGIKASIVNSGKAVINIKFVTAFCHAKRRFRMETKEQNVEDMDVIKQLMDIMGQQGMNEQSQDFLEMLNFVAGMQVRLVTWWMNYRA